MCQTDSAKRLRCYVFRRTVRTEPSRAPVAIRKSFGTGASNDVPTLPTLGSDGTQATWRVARNETETSQHAHRLETRHANANAASVLGNPIVLTLRAGLSSSGAASNGL